MGKIHQIDMNMACGCDTCLTLMQGDCGLRELVVSNRGNMKTLTEVNASNDSESVHMNRCHSYDYSSVLWHSLIMPFIISYASLNDRPQSLPSLISDTSFLKCRRPSSFMFSSIILPFRSSRTNDFLKSVHSSTDSPYARTIPILHYDYYQYRVV